MWCGYYDSGDYDNLFRYTVLAYDGSSLFVVMVRVGWIAFGRYATVARGVGTYFDASSPIAFPHHIYMNKCVIAICYELVYHGMLCELQVPWMRFGHYFRCCLFVWWKKGSINWQHMYERVELKAVNTPARMFSISMCMYYMYCLFCELD